MRSGPACAMRAGCSGTPRPNQGVDYAAICCGSLRLRANQGAGEEVTVEILGLPLLCLLLGYALGAIPFGLLLTRAAGLGDVRRIGSGNIGATNVLRTGRKGLAVATLLLDGAKGAAAPLIVYRF